VSLPPLLVVEHESDAPAGWMGEWLVDAGLLLDVRRPYAGQALPVDLRAHSGMLVLGGEMGAYDDALHPWLGEVKQLVVVAARDRHPALGICLGHQLAAVALGGTVARNPRGQQVGVLDVGWTEAARRDPLVGGLRTSGAPTPAVQWNNDLVTRLPDGAVELARTGAGELQAARYAETVWGVQWHPEVGEEIIGAWAEHDRDAAVERGVDVDAHVAEVAAARTALRAAWRPLADRFAEVCRERMSAVSAR
jgi:GMP synthase (glutamine-hydrolysing)